MTKRQAHTLTGLGITIILTQILCTAVLVSKVESTQKSARSAEVSAVDAMEYSKRLESRNAEATDSRGGKVTNVLHCQQHIIQTENAPTSPNALLPGTTIEIDKP